MSEANNTYLSFNEDEFLNNFKRYKMTIGAERDYRRDAKNGADAPKEAIEFRLSVLMHFAQNVEVCIDNAKKYQFYNFVIIADDAKNEIKLVYWTNRKLWVNPTISSSLSKVFKLLGMDDRGYYIIHNNKAINVT